MFKSPQRTNALDARSLIIPLRFIVGYNREPCKCVMCQTFNVLKGN